MERTVSRRRPLALALALMAALALSLGFALPMTAKAEEREIMAYSLDSAGGRTNYYDTWAALQAGYTGKTIYLACDWNFTGAMKIDSGKTIVIDMNGHQISNSGSSQVINVGSKANLTLTSSQTKTFTYVGYSDYTYEYPAKDDPCRKEFSVETGGLVTGGCNYSFTRWLCTAGGITLDFDSTLTLSNVAVAGNYGDYAGGIYARGGCNVYMNNGAILEHNKGRAGGIHVNNSDTNIVLNASYIRENYGWDEGGGIYTGADGTRIYLNNHAEIAGNHAEYGGGVSINGSYFNIGSDDKTGVICNNRAELHGGGGIFVSYDTRTNEGGIDGITISGNFGMDYGGGIYLNQEWTTVSNCTITGNSSYYGAAGIYVNNDHCTLADCTITENVCNVNKEYEYIGGGVCVDKCNDVTLSGVMIVENNYAQDKGATTTHVSNFCLGATEFWWTHAYIMGGVEEGSRVYFDADCSSDLRIGKNITTYVPGTYFSDLGDEYYYTHGTDEGGDIWQRVGATDFAVTLNGKTVGRYKKGATVKVNCASDDEKVFLQWNKDETSGLNPFDASITDVTDPSVSFTMPNNDVDLVADCVTRATKVWIQVVKPVGGNALPTTATLRWDGGSVEVPVSWLDENGAYATTATYGAGYKLVVSAPEDCDGGLVFKTGIDASDVEVACTDGTKTTTESAGVDACGTLNVTSGDITAAKEVINVVRSSRAVVCGGTSVEHALESLPNTVSVTYEDGTTALLATDKTNIVWDGDSPFEDEKVVEPDQDVATYTGRLYLAESSEVEGANEEYTQLSFVVYRSTASAAPSLTLEEGTYEVGDDLKLTATVYSPVEGAKVMAQVGNGAAYELADVSAGIELTGVRGSTASVEVSVWSVSEDGKESSDKSTKTYTLCNAHGKSIEIACSDTAQYAEGEERWSKSFTVTGDTASEVTISAPAYEGHVFDHWEWDEAPKGTDLSGTTLAIKSFSADYEGEIKAVYAPVVTSVDLGLSVPEAHEALATTATVKVGLGDGAPTRDITSHFAGTDEGATVSWSPEADSGGKAEHGVRYVASLAMDASSAPSGVKYVLADELKLYVNGSETGRSAYVASASDGAKTLNASFDALGYVCEAVEEPEVIELAFAQALGCQATQDGKGSSGWGLPNQVLATYACGESAGLSVVWDAVNGFDATATGAQELTVTGSVVYPSGVDHDGMPETVTATIKVATPETVSVPGASVEPGEYGEAQSVALGSDTKGAVVRYTTDGSEPTEESPVYDGEPIQVTETTTIKARAYCDGMLASEVGEFTYIISSNPDPGPDPEPDVDPDDDSDPSGGSEDKGEDKQLPQTGDAASVSAFMTAVGAALAAAGIRRRK